jgi:thiol:disulfide interchange protein DsbG
MRSLVVVSTVFLIPALAAAEPQCAISSAMATPANVAEPLPAARLASADVDASRHATAVQDSALPAVLRHVAGAGAQLTEMGSAHGLRSVVARNGQQFLMLHVVPDGSAAVAGVIAELTPTQLLAAAPGQTRELGTAHGLRGIFVSSGSQFQVFYVTPDGERVIPGAMWDSAGKNVTRDQVSPISGAVATVEIGPGASGVPVDAAPPLVASSLAAAQAATSGLIGDLTAPKLWIFIDPMCSFSVRAMQQLQPLIEAKRLQVAVIPIAILDHEDNGRSTSSALSMLSQVPDQMVPAWAGGWLNTPASPEAPSRLAANRAATEAIGLRGTPTLIWRKWDGSEGRSDGMPSDLNALVASIGR